VFSLGSVSVPGNSLSTPQQKLEEYVFSKSLSTDAFLIFQNGRIVYEKYANGYTTETPHPLWSVTKSISMAIFGLAEAEGKISSEDFVSKWFPEAEPKIWGDVKLSHLLSMTSGVSWNEAYERNPLASSVVSLLYKESSFRDMAHYRLNHGKKVKPAGTRFNYSSGDTNLLMAALKKALGSSAEIYPWDKLFTPLGISSFTLMQDGAGTFIGSSYGICTARDLIKFGELFLNDGKWDGKRVLSSEWIKKAYTPNSAFNELRLDHRPMEAYGMSWWLNTPIPTAQIGKEINLAPVDAYSAQGHYGQYLFIIPSEKLIVVRLATDKDGTKIDLNRLFTLLQPALKEGMR